MKETDVEKEKTKREKRVRVKVKDAKQERESCCERARNRPTTGPAHDDHGTMMSLYMTG